VEARVRKITVPPDAVIEFTYARVPAETPFGVRETPVAEVRTGGRRYQKLSPGGPGLPPPEFIDVETGEAVLLLLPEGYD
jgi:hypothetical protein